LLRWPVKLADVTSLADRTISALRANNDELAKIVQQLKPEQLTDASGASEWTIAQVLSHLGSGAEIGLRGLLTALDEAPKPAEGFNQSVWDRWDAMSPQEQAAGFLEHNERLVENYENLSPEQRETLTLDLGFGPQPFTVASAGGLRLSEAASHAWDVRAGLDSSATLPDAEAALLAEFYSGDLGFLLGFIGKADQLEAPAVVALAGTDYQLAIAERAALTRGGAEATATFNGPLEAAVRLAVGRLKPEYTPSGVTVSGNVTLDDLRRVFPGF
jgi:uncharacterized protein (TIGR03083 family)